MVVSHDPVQRIVNVHWRGLRPPVFMSLGFNLFKPFGIGDWNDYMTMATFVDGLPELSRDSFTIVVDSFSLEGDEDSVSEEWTIDDHVITGSASLSSVGTVAGSIGYHFVPAAVPNELILALNSNAPRVIDRNLAQMNVPIDLYVTGVCSGMTEPTMTEHVVIAPTDVFGAVLTVQIHPPSMSLTLT